MDTGDESEYKKAIKLCKMCAWKEFMQMYKEYTKKSLVYLAPSLGKF